jgi:hypothetical protein
MSKSFKIIPFPGQPNEYFIGIDPHGYDGRVATCCVMKRECINNHTVVVAQYKGRPDNDFKAQVQEYINYYKIPAESIARFDKQ